jgi:hypothetical protein
MSIPNIIHFIYALAPDGGGKEFCLVHYLAVKSARLVNNPDKIFLYYSYEPEENIWWEKTREMVQPEKITPPQAIYGNKLHHAAHKADVVRLEKLIQRGGIYLDIDTICVKPFHPLRRHAFVMGYEKNNKTIGGLCNAVMLSEKNAIFPRAWLQTYQWFRSTGRDRFWAEHSVRVPYRLSKNLPELASQIHIEPPASFFSPSYHSGDLENMFRKKATYPGAYCHHLWESFSYDKYLKNITVDFIKEADTTYNLIARRFI